MNADRCELAYGDNRDRRCAWDGKPIPTGRRRWCTDACARTWADNHVWTAARTAALNRDGRACVVCRDPEDLEVHHKVPVGRSGYGQSCLHHLDNLETLCYAHHVEADAARRHAEQGQPVQLSLIAA